MQKYKYLRILILTSSTIVIFAFARNPKNCFQKLLNKLTIDSEHELARHSLIVCLMYSIPICGERMDMIGPIAKNATNI